MFSAFFSLFHQSADVDVGFFVNSGNDTANVLDAVLVKLHVAAVTDGAGAFARVCAVAVVNVTVRVVRRMGSISAVRILLR